MKTVAIRDAEMKLEKICTLTKRTAEAEDTKQESRTKPTYFTRTRKMSFTELVYYILHPGTESTRLGLTRFFAMLGKEGCGMSEQAFSKARSHFNHSENLIEKDLRLTLQCQQLKEDWRNAQKRGGTFVKNAN